MNTTVQLKRISTDEIPEALERAARYRELDESAQAESICHDIILADPHNQRAHILLLQALCDRFGRGYTVDFIQALEILPRLEDPYDRAFYAGFICDHKANALLSDAENGYEKAEKLRPRQCGEARQRWNACARIISANRLEPWPVEPEPEPSEE